MMLVTGNRNWVRRSFAILTAVFLFGLAVAGLARAAEQPDAVAAAWERARASRSYAFDSDIVITNYPLPSLANTGRAPQVDRLAIAGQVDQRAETMEFTLWNHARREPEQGLQVRVEDGEAMQRLGFGEWEPADGMADLFAPGGDAFRILEAAENFEAVGTDTRTVGETSITFEYFRFDLNGPYYAELMRRELQERLAKKGELPYGITLQAPERYRAMQGGGELWIGPDGLPARMKLQMDFPLQGRDPRFTSEVVLDFSDFERDDVFGPTLSKWDALVSQLNAEAFDLSALAQSPASSAGLGALIAVLCWIMIRGRRSRRVYLTVVILTVGSMIVVPLLQARSVEAFTQNALADTAAREQEQAEAQAKAAARRNAAQSQWDPHAAPSDQGLLEITDSPADVRNVVSTRDLTTVDLPVLTSVQATGAQTDTTDTDGDGLLDVDEAYYETCDGSSGSFCDGITDPKDHDGDGLSDGLEVHEIGTDPKFDDSDSDGISDGVEVEGFSFGGSTWYLNPREADSNRDGLPDGLECENLTGPLTCPDTDGDGDPDVFDMDNDNDGVNDAHDLSPFARGTGAFDADNPLALTINNLEVDKPVFVDVQLRPTDASNLYLKDNVLDWPAGDTRGQIQHAMTTTFASTANVDAQSSGPQAADGDIRLVPTLVIDIPGQSGHYANLPVTTTASASRVDGQPVEEWIDASQLEPFNIDVQDTADPPDNNLDVFVPLAPVIDDTDGTVAFQGRMLYRPSQGTDGVADWGPAHQFRVVWLVQMLADQCVDPEDDPATCVREDVLTVVHVYDEEWVLTGLDVSEQHGLETAVVYEDPSLDPDQEYEDQLTTLAWNLANTFMRGRDCDTLNAGVCGSDGARDVTVSNLAATISDSAWLGADSYLAVHNFAFEHQAYAIKLASESVVPLLDSEWGSPPSGDPTPLILYVSENTSRSVNLDQTSAPSAGTPAVFDVGSASATVTGAMRWAPYRHSGTAWVAADKQAYLDLLEQRLPANPFFQPADSTRVAQDVAVAKISWAQVYYAALMQGFGAILALDGTTVWAENPDIPETEYEPLFAVGSTTGLATILNTYLEIAIRGISNTSKRLWLKNLYEIATRSDDLGQSAAFVQSAKSAHATAYSIIAGILIVAAVVGVTLYLVGYFTGNQTLVRVAEIILAVVTIIIVIIQIMVLVKAVASALAAGSGLLAALQGGGAIYGIGFLIGALVAWGYVAYWFFFSGGRNASTVEQNVVISVAIAVTVYLAFLLILSVFGLGFLGLVLFLVDAFFLIAGKKGPSTYIMEWLAGLIYDVDLLLTNVDSEDRLDLDLASFEYANPRAGMVPSNAVTVSVDVTNTVHYKKAFNADQAKKRSVFKYHLHAAPPEIPYHENLSVGDSQGDWQDLSGRWLQMTDSKEAVVALADVGTGVNKGLPLTLTEAFLLSWRGCWGAVTNTGCSWDKTKDSMPIDLGEMLTYDILPDTVGQFARMDWGAGGGLGLPQQRDKDGDGLSGLDGTDPNDTQPDTDGDGLTDLYEHANGLDAEVADGDGDGLSDADELRLSTNPHAADTDGDGLNDRIEAQEGWLITYDGGKTMRVWSDPLRVDADNDGLNDLKEYAFGFHPSVPSDPSLVRDLVKFDDIRVIEVEAPLLALPFEETAGSTIFEDVSGSELFAACDSGAGACPAASMAGAVGRGLHFDGVDDVLNVNEDFDLRSASFTVAAWVKRDSFGEPERFFGHGHPTSGPVALSVGFNANDQFMCDLTETNVSATGSTTDTEWHHWVCTYNADSGELLLYRDGTAISQTTTNIGANFYHGNGPVKIGQAHDAALFSGGIDEVAFFSRALAAPEIADLMAGIYNPDDLIVTPGAGLAYQALVTNTVSSVGVDGVLVGRSEYITPAIGVPAAAFSFEPDQYVTTFENGTGEGSGATCLGDGTCPTLQAPGQIGKAVQFDGDGDVVQAPVLARGSEGLIAAWWLKLDALPAAGEFAYVVDTLGGDIGNLDVRIDDSGKLRIGVAGAIGHISSFSFSGNLNTWVHVAFELNARGVSALWVDGALDSREYRSGWSAEVVFGPGEFGAGLAGTLDEFVIFYDPYFTSIQAEAFDDKKATTIAAIMNGDYSPALDISDDSESDLAATLIYKFEDDPDYDGQVFENDADNAIPLVCATEATCPAIERGGAVREAVAFDGVDDYIPLNAEMTFSTRSNHELIVDLWVSVASLPASRNQAYIIDATDTTTAGSNYFQMYLDHNGRIHVVMFEELVSNFRFDTSTLNQWVHLEIFTSGGSSLKTIHLYIDGVEDAQTGSGGFSRNLEFGTGRLGSKVDGTGFFDGSIDELFIEEDDPFFDDLYDVPFDLPLSNVALIDSITQARGAFCLGACPDVDSAGAFGSALMFDGIYDYVVLDPTDFAQGDYTVSLWFKSNSTSVARSLFAAFDSDSELPGVLVELAADGRVRFLNRFPPGGSGGDAVFSPASYDDNAWHHVAAVRDGTTMSLYVDGALAASDSASGRAAAPMDVVLGRFGSFDARYLDGGLDEVTVIPAATAQDGVQVLMNSTYPAISIADDFVPFSTGPQSSALISGSSRVSPAATASDHEIDIEAEAALDLSEGLTYPAAGNHAADLIHLLPFEEATGSTTFDDAVGATDPTCEPSDCPTAGLRGRVGRAAFFDGVDDALQLTSSDIYRHTIAAWVKAERGTLVDMTRQLDEGLAGAHLDFNRFRLYGTRFDNPETYVLEVPFTVTENEWVHIAAVYELVKSRTSLNNLISVYVNGELVGTDLEPSSFPDYRSRDPLVGRNKTGTDPLLGRLDDLRVYGVALSAADIADLYATSAPVLQFEFEEDQNATAFVDASDHGYVGAPLIETAFDATIDETVETISPAPGVVGRIGSGVLFDGRGYIEVLDADDVGSLTNDFTIMAWVRPEVITDVHRILATGRAATPDGFGFGIKNSSLVFTTWAIKGYFSSVPLETDRWQHVAVVFDQSNDAHFYIDGELADTVTGSSPANANTDDPLYIGMTTVHAGSALIEHFVGGIDELVVYQRSLGAAEINSIYLREFRWYRARGASIVRVDTAPPTVELLSAADYYPNGYIQLAVAALDTGSPIQRVDFGLKGPSDSTFTWHVSDMCAEAEMSRAAWCPSFDSSALGGEGVYEIQFRAYDSVGHVTLSPVHTMRVDGSAPEVTTTLNGSWEALTPAGEGERTWSLSLSGTISDPDIGASVPGSGVYTPNVTVALLDGRGKPAGTGPQLAEISDDVWSVDYIIEGAQPQGTYLLEMVAEDNVGNRDTTTFASGGSGAVKLDARPPEVEIDIWDLGEFISAPVTLVGLAVEAPNWGSALARYHFEEIVPSAEDGYTLYDHSPLGNHASCTACPSLVSSIFGSGLDFDGTDDFVSVPNLFNPISDAFSISLWFDVDSGSSGTRVLVQQLDGTGVGRALMFLDDSNSMRTFLGGTGSTGTASVSADSWHHAVLTFDGVTAKLYLDGQLGWETDVAPEAADGGLLLGNHKNLAHFFPGQMDEVQFYGEALSADQVYALAQPEHSGIESVEVWLQTEDFDGTPPAPNWQPANLAAPSAGTSAWDFTLPAQLEEYYHINLQARDEFGNTSNQRRVWRGPIDMVAPRITFSATHIVDGAERATEYDFVIEDLAIDADTVSQPCPVTSLVHTLHPVVTDTLKIEGSCQVSGYDSGPVRVAACDMAGHCSQETIDLIPPTDVNGTGCVDISDVQDVASHWREVPGDDADLQKRDVNGDGVINIRDVMRVVADMENGCCVDMSDVQDVASHWREVPGDDADLQKRDVNSDGVINIRDVMRVVANMENGC